MGGITPPLFIPYEGRSIRLSDRWFDLAHSIQALTALNTLAGAGTSSLNKHVTSNENIKALH